MRISQALLILHIIFLNTPKVWQYQIMASVFDSHHIAIYVYLCISIDKVSKTCKDFQTKMN